MEPNAADLQQQITAVEAQLLAEGTASSLLKRVQEDMAQQRRVIQDLHRDLAAYVRASLGGKPGATRRDIMRTLGFNFEVTNTPPPNAAAEPEASLAKDDAVQTAAPTSQRTAPPQAGQNTQEPASPPAPVPRQESRGEQQRRDSSLSQSPLSIKTHIKAGSVRNVGTTETGGGSGTPPGNSPPDT